MLGLIPRRGTWAAKDRTQPPSPSKTFASYKLRNAPFRENSSSTPHAKRHQNQRRLVKHPKRPLMHFDILLKTTDNPYKLFKNEKPLLEFENHY